jgi:hypothetical protein
MHNLAHAEGMGKGEIRISRVKRPRFCFVISALQWVKSTQRREDFKAIFLNHETHKIHEPRIPFSHFRVFRVFCG